MNDNGTHKQAWQLKELIAVYEEILYDLSKVEKTLVRVIILCEYD